MKTNKIKNQKLNAFTLVELIVVITILAILGTIALIAFNKQAVSARDSSRVADVNNITKWLWVQFAVASKYPIPDKKVTITWSWTPVWYQWEIWDTNKNIIKLSSNWWKDPLTNSNYTYNTNTNQAKYQVMAFLESSDSITWIDSIANNNSKQIPYVRWDYLGIIVNSSSSNWVTTYSPIQDSWVSSFELKTNNSTNKVILSNSTAPTWVDLGMKLTYTNSDWTLVWWGDCSSVTNNIWIDWNTWTCIDNRLYYMQWWATHDKEYWLLKIEWKWRFNENIAYPLDSSKYRWTGDWSTSDNWYFSCPGTIWTNTVKCNLVATWWYMYQWSAVMAWWSSNTGALGRTKWICPTGWALPVVNDFVSLTWTYWTNSTTNDNRNWSTVWWNRSYMGYRSVEADGPFRRQGSREYYWTSVSWQFWCIYNAMNPLSTHSAASKTFGFSVRCVKN